jgi:hypothetical protein
MAKPFPRLLGWLNHSQWPILFLFYFFFFSSIGLLGWSNHPNKGWYGMANKTYLFEGERLEFPGQGEWNPEDLDELEIGRKRRRYQSNLQPF